MKKRGVILIIIFLMAGLCLLVQGARAQSREEADRLNQQVVQLYQQGRYNEAIPYAQKYLDACRHIYGEDNANTAGAYNNLAGLYYSTGQYAKAEPLFNVMVK